MLVRLCSKSFNLGFNSTWTENFHRYKLDLEKAEEPEIKCQQPENHRKKQGNSRKTSTSVSPTTLKPLTVWITTNWKILKKMEKTEHLTCLFRNLYAGQETTIRTGHGTIGWFKVGKGVHQGFLLSSCLFNLYARYIMQNVGLDESQAGSMNARRNTNNLRYADDTIQMAASEEELNTLLMMVQEE